MKRITQACAVAALAMGLALLAAGPALAQTNIPSSSSRGFQPPVKQKALPGDAPSPPPPGLPGAQSTYAPAEATATDLKPNEALFDAINRGDIAAAREALNRGADLGSHNVLGMTPVELSVDLSRNDITFLLLSVRSGSTPAPRGASAAAAAALLAAPAPGKAPPKQVAVAKPAPKPVVPASSQQQFAGNRADPGTPDPKAGFLGFGGTVQ